MANYDLAFPGAAIDAILTTAYDLQNAGYIFKGSATNWSGTPTQRTWLLAPAGFSGYGFSSAIPKGSIGICKYNGSAWSGDVINVVTIDSTVTNGSTNPVSGDAVWDAMDELATGIRDTLLSFTITDGTASADQASKLTYDVKMTDGQGGQHLIGSFNILAATAYKAGLMSAADKAKVDAFLDNLRSLSFTDTTPGADVGTKIVETLKMTVGGVEEAVTALTILAATTSKAGLMSASDKSYIDGLPSEFTAIGSSLSTISTNINNLLAMLGYYECSTAAGTAAKTVSASGYVLTTGGCIRIKMTNANTADNVTLNINSTGDKALYYDGAQASASNSWEAGEVLEVYYDGTQYQVTSTASKNIPAQNVSIGSGTLANYFERSGNFDSSFLIYPQKYAGGAVGDNVGIGSFASLNYGRAEIREGAVITLNTQAYGSAVAYVITDADGIVLERASGISANLTNYVVNKTGAAYIYINCANSYLESFIFQYYSLFPDLVNNYDGGANRIPSAELVRNLKISTVIEETYISEFGFPQTSDFRDFYANQGDLLLFEFEGNTGTRTRIDYRSESALAILFSLEGNIQSYQIEAPANILSIRNYSDTSIYVKITNLTKKFRATVEEGVKTLTKRRKVVRTILFDASNPYNAHAYYPMDYMLDDRSILKIYNIVYSRVGTTQLILYRGNGLTVTDSYIQMPSGEDVSDKVVYMQPIGKCGIIGCLTNGKFTCNIDIIQYLDDWDESYPTEGVRIVTLGDSITSISHSNIGFTTSLFLHADLIYNFALAQAYAADFVNTEPYFDTHQGSDSPDNVLSNQVRRLLRWTTPEGQQITWTHPIDGEFSIDTSVGTGQGHTDDIPDIIYIAIGTNDAVNKIDADLAPVIASSYTDLTRLTMGSAYRWAVETLQSAYPNAMIFMASPLYDGSAGNPTNMINKGNIVKQICDLTGAYYIPSREESGYTRLASVTGGRLHPGTEWSLRIGQFVAKKISETFLGTYHDN